MSRFSRRFRIWARQAKRYIVQTNDSPRQIAGGVAVGIFVAFTPTIGFQMIIAAVVTTVMRLSRWPALVAVYISNPITLVPMYTGLYFFGTWLLLPFTSRFNTQELVAKLQAVLEIPAEGNLWEKVYALSANVLGLGWEIVIPLWLGCLVAGAIAAALMYYVTLRFVTGQRMLKAQRMVRRAKKRLDHIRQEQAHEKGGSAGGASP